MNTGRKKKNRAIMVMRWSARILGLIIAGFFLLMFFGETINSNSSSEPIKPIADIGVALMWLYVVAMFLAVKMERVGSLLGLAAMGCFYIILFMGLLPGNVEGGFSTKGILNPFFLVFWLPILLYLLCWILEGRERK